MAGGGVARGQVVGRSDKIASDPLERAVSPKDILATIYHLLGIDPSRHHRRSSRQADGDRTRRPGDSRSPRLSRPITRTAHAHWSGARRMNRCLRIAGIAVVMFFEHASVAFAGMPSITLSDLARMRFQTISFFLVLFLLVLVGDPVDLERGPERLPAAAVSELSPGDWAWWPLWGLLFLLILTMISGARELMTPGAWKKEGFTYKLKDDADPAKRTGERPRSRSAEPRSTASRSPLDVCKAPRRSLPRERFTAGNPR